MVETQYWIKKPDTKVCEEWKWGVEFAGHKQVKAEIGRYLAMVPENQMDVWISWKNGTALNQQTFWWCKGMGEPLPDPAPPLPWMPPAPPGDNEGAQCSEIEGVPPRYVYLQTSLSSAEFFYFDADANDCKWNKDHIPDLLTDEVTSAGQCTTCCVVLQLTSMLQMRAVYWENLTLKRSIDRQERDFQVLLLSILSGHFTVYFTGYLIRIIKRTM